MKQLLAVLLLGSTAVFAEPITLDKAHASVEFTVQHLMITNVTGRFDKVDAKGDFDEQNLKLSTLEVTIDATSINTNQTKRDDHLRGPDFFDVKKFPTLTFKLSEATKVKKGKKVSLPGVLTIRGVSKPVTLEFIYQGAAKDPYGNYHYGFEATTVINRTDFGLTWNAALETGGVTVGEEVTIKTSGEMLKGK